MRTLFLILLALFVTPALAQEWQSYGNARFGYVSDIPPGFALSGQSDNGDGQTWYSERGAKGLLVWGGPMQGDFESAVTDAMDYAVAENGFNISYRAVTPRWASFSGVRGSRILYQRMVLLCDGSSYAAFRLDYSVVDMAAMDATIERMVLGLKGDC